MLALATEGIPLRSLEYKESQRIVTLFTEEAGLLTLIIKGLSKKKPHLMHLTTPFCIATYHYLHGKTDLHRFHDATLKDDLAPLRTSLARLRSAGVMAHTLLRTQLPEKTTPALYHLFRAYLLALRTFPEPSILTASFLLKFLLHEGLLSASHPPPFFTTKEWDALFPLATTKQFSALPTTPLTPELLEKLLSYLRST